MTETPQIGRNEPCPCGSGKKYKRCCGVSAAPKLSTPSAPAFGAGAPGMEQFKDQFDPQMMTQFAQMIGRLPKGQLQKLQSIMQKAMSGKDVSREAKEFESSLPVELQSLLQTFQMPNMAGMAGMGGGMPGLPAAALNEAEASEPVMSEEDARKIVEAAAKEGKISSEQADTLLQASPNASASDKAGISKLWKKLSGK